MASRNYNRIATKIVLFIINPAISAVISLKDLRDGISHRFLYLWFIIFGIGFCALNESADSYRYVESFAKESNYTTSQYLLEVRDYFTFQSDIKDIYTLSVNFFVGRFSDNYHWTYLIYAIVFGFFYIKSLKIFLRHNKVGNNLVFYMLLFIFCFSNPIFNINGVRFWTAAWIGVYVSLKLFVDRDYRQLPLLLLLPLVHGTSIIWVIIMLISLLVSRLQGITILLFIISSFISAVSYFSLIGDYTHLLPQFMQNQIYFYTESQWAIERMEGATEYGTAYANFLISLPGYFNLVLSYLLIINRKKINKNKESKHLLTIMLAMSALTNFISGVPSLHRFQAFVIPFLVIIWAQNYRILKKYDYLFIIVPLIYAYSLLYWCRHMLSVTELYLFVLPAPLTVFKYLFL